MTIGDITTVKIRTVKKVGFFGALSILLGSVVGVGIFFKNHSVLRGTEWSGTGTLVAWIIGGLLSLFAAIAFSEIGGLKTKRSTGLGEWTTQTCGKKLGYFTRFNYSIFYFGLLMGVLGVFVSEAIINTFVTLSSTLEQPDVWVHIVFGAVLIAFFYILSYISIRASGWVQLITTAIKFIPLLFVGIAGVVLATTNANPTSKGLFGQNAFSNGQVFSFTKVLAVLPAILFAFDSFLNVAGLGKKVEGGERKTSIIVLIGMIIVIGLYLLIALGAILHGSGMLTGAPFKAPPAAGLGILDQIFTNEKTAIAFGKVITITIAISAIGVGNGISTAAQTYISQSIDNEIVFGSRFFKNKLGKHGVLVYGLLIGLVWVLVAGIPAIIYNSDSFIDGISNFPTLFSFGLYVPVLVVYSIKRKSFDNSKANKYLFYTSAILAAGGIAFVVLYQLVYGFPMAAVNEPDATTHWGLFVGDQGATGRGQFINNKQGLILFLSCLAIFFILPGLNYLGIKYGEKRDPLSL